MKNKITIVSGHYPNNVYFANETKKILLLQRRLF